MPTLAITRNVGESFFIRPSNGEEIIVTLAKTSQGRARIRITAPAEVHIMRKEIDDRKPEAIAS